MKSGFYVGCRVVCVKPFCGIRQGMTGTICQHKNESASGKSWGIAWDEDVNGGHDCGGTCRYGYGYRVREGIIKCDNEPDDGPCCQEEDIYTLLFGGINGKEN